MPIRDLDPDNDYAYDPTNQSAPAFYIFTLTCSCGWTHEASSRGSASTWKDWHRSQHTPKGSRPSDCGHVVTVTRSSR